MFGAVIGKRLETNSSAGILNKARKMELISVGHPLVMTAGTDGSSARILGFSYLLKVGFSGLFLSFGKGPSSVLKFWYLGIGIVGKTILNMRLMKNST
jgi:hypothetical protein